MQHTHFAVVGPCKWTAIRRSKGIADIALVNGRFEINIEGASLEDLDVVRAFVKDKQRRTILFSPVV